MTCSRLQKKISQRIRSCDWHHMNYNKLWNRLIFDNNKFISGLVMGIIYLSVSFSNSQGTFNFYYTHRIHKSWKYYKSKKLMKYTVDNLHKTETRRGRRLGGRLVGYIRGYRAKRFVPLFSDIRTLVYIHYKNRHIARVWRAEGAASIISLICLP